MEIQLKFKFLGNFGVVCHLVYDRKFILVAASVDPCCLYVPNFSIIRQASAGLLMIQEIFMARFFGGGATFPTLSSQSCVDRTISNFGGCIGQLSALQLLRCVAPFSYQSHESHTCSRKSKPTFVLSDRCTIRGGVGEFLVNSTNSA